MHFLFFVHRNCMCFCKRQSTTMHAFWLSNGDRDYDSIGRPGEDECREADDFYSLSFSEEEIKLRPYSVGNEYS